MKIFCINIQHLLTLVRNNISQQNLAIASGIYLGLSVRNFIQIHTDLTFLLYDVLGVHFLPDAV